MHETRQCSSVQLQGTDAIVNSPFTGRRMGAGLESHSAAVHSSVFPSLSLF